MRLCNFRIADSESCGVLTPRGIVDCGVRLGSSAGDLLSLLRSNRIRMARDLAESAQCDYSLDEVRLLNPAGRFTRYFCIGVNYPDRNEEYKDGSERPKYPSIFMRTHTSFAGPGEPILRPRESEQLDYEGEIALMIGHGGRRIPQEKAREHVFGYCCANEGSVRDWLRHSKFNVTQGKNFDRSGSLGPWLVTADEVGAAPLRVTTRVNGEVRQDDTSDRMIFPIPYLISYVSTFCSLEPGDVILTGTPSGAGARFDPPRYLRPGDVVEVEVSRVGALRNEVADDRG
ncbi:MAG TPA: fumarylacetoacetate hydrolase family protein [Steroidobacteraceae bacterium]|nr:fumarylacetoacetate hydrolase family protein [Steroidobacteraceae bacterium]